MSAARAGAAAGSTGDWDALVESWSGPTARGTLRPAAVEGMIVGGRYQLRTPLGAGGMGKVWLADDTVLRRPVALKRAAYTDGEDDPALLREARAASRVAHPGVVRIHDIVVDHDDSWIVMEALRGQTLSMVLQDAGRLSVDEVVVVGLQLLSALQAIHAAGLVHRDVKPGNIHVCDRRRVVLTDFGLATPPGVWGGLLAGAVAGSPPYLAPESMLHGLFGPPSDLYALGVTLYRAVEGRRPFAPSRPSSAESLISPRPRPVQYAGRLEGLLAGLLEPDADCRLDAAEAKSQLEAMTLVMAMPWAG